MFKKIISGLLSIQLAFLPTVLAETSGEERAPASDADYVHHHLKEMFSGRPSTKFYSSKKESTTLEKILNGNQEFYVSEGKAIFGFKALQKKTTMSVAISVYDPKFKLLDGRSVTLDSNLTAGQNVMALEAAQQSLLNSLREHGMAQKIAEDRAIASQSEVNGAGWMITIGCLLAIASAIGWRTATLNKDTYHSSRTGAAYYIGIIIALIGAAMLGNAHAEP
jgi:hypothetical protein